MKGLLRVMVRKKRVTLLMLVCGCLVFASLRFQYRQIVASQGAFIYKYALRSFPKEMSRVELPNSSHVLKSQVNSRISTVPPMQNMTNRMLSRGSNDSIIAQPSNALSRKGSGTSQNVTGRRDGKRSSLLQNDGKTPLKENAKVVQDPKEHKHHPPLLSNSKHKLGQTDFSLYDRYKNVDVVGKYCTPELCLPVDGLERNYHQKCLRNALSLIELKSLYNNQNLTLGKCSCGFKATKSKYARVGLVSLPGSGNTWLRGLLERATGICTGSMWCDPGLRATHFCGEGLRDTRLLAVKNHDSVIRWRGQELHTNLGFSEHNKPEFDAVVFLHRNLVDALVAEHNRAIASALWEASVRKGHQNELKLSNHLLSFGAEYFGENKEWHERVIQLTLVWERMVNHLLLNSKNRPVLLIRYEDLKTDPLHEVKQVVEFLGYDIPESVLRDRLMGRQFNDFHRNHTETFEHFTKTQMKFINATFSRVPSTLKSRLFL